MEDVFFLDVIMRWFHIIGAIVTAGSMISALLVMLPTICGLSDEIRKPLFETIRSRMSKLFMFGMTALLISGFYNYFAIELSAHSGQKLYHGLMGVKIILAFVVFFISSAMLGRSKAFEGIRRRRRRWMSRNILFLLIIIAIASVLRAMRDTPTSVG